MGASRDVDEVGLVLLLLGLAVAVYLAIKNWNGFWSGMGGAMGNMASGVDVAIYPLKSSQNSVVSKVGNGIAGFVDPILAYLVGVPYSIAQSKPIIPLSFASPNNVQTSPQLPTLGGMS